MTQAAHFKDWSLEHWSYAYGEPQSQGRLKALPEDFVVTEKLGYELSGEGENLYLLIEKTGLNTHQVLEHLAKVFNKRLRDVGYAGLKDKLAITRQWFSIQMNVKQAPDLSSVETEQIKLIETIRHGRKLKVGALKSNHFAIRLKNVTDIKAVETKLSHIATFGVPNYFGEQRFGFKGNNLNWANRMADGETIRDRKIKGFALSACRSYLFNEVLSERLAGHESVPLLDGEVFELAGSNSYFQQEMTEEIRQRIAEQDIYISGPLFGKGEMISVGDVASIENAIAARHNNWITLLQDNGLKQERRALWLFPKMVKTEIENNDLCVSFEIPSGTFATSVIRECIKVVEDENISQ